MKVRQRLGHYGYCLGVDGGDGVWVRLRWWEDGDTWGMYCQRSKASHEKSLSSDSISSTLYYEYGDGTESIKDYDTLPVPSSD